MKKRYEISPEKNKNGSLLASSGGPLEGQAVEREAAAGAEGVVEEAVNAPFCRLQEKFHTFVSRGLRNISEAP